jgi:hypothetical protein
MPFGNQEENRMGSQGEGQGRGAGRKPRYEVPEHGAVQGLTTTIPPTPIFPTFGANAGVPTTTDVRPFGTLAAPTSTHTYTTTFGLYTFVVEPTRSPSSLQPATAAATATTEARST